MRTACVPLFFTTSLMICGCGSAPNPHHQRGKNGGYLYFDPHLNLKLPGDWFCGGGAVPTDESDLIWIASGKSKLKGPELAFEAKVTEFCAASLRGRTDQEMLESPLLGLALLSDKTVSQHGPNKYPALEVTCLSAKKEYVRYRIVYAKPTLYVISATSSVRDWLTSIEAIEFLGSLTVTSSDPELNRNESFSTGW